MNFCQYFKPISISLSPNVQWDDVWLAIKLFVRTVTPLAPLNLRGGVPPLNIRGGKGELPVRLLEQKFKDYLGAKYAFSFNSGRSALYTILKAIELKPGDEVLLQAFTCNAVPNPVLWAGLPATASRALQVGGTPIYVDIDDTLNIDPEDLERKLTLRQASATTADRQGKPRAVIIQNTFGIPAQIDKILEIARRHNLIVIEDCAHALGARYKTKGGSDKGGSDPPLVGTFGDVAFFSFGRDKVISSVWGGIVTTNNDVLAQKIASMTTSPPSPSPYQGEGESEGVRYLATPSKIWTIKQLLHPILFAIIIPTYYIFGKYLLAFLRVVRGVGLAVSARERRGEKPEMFPARMPEALAELALHQFNKLEVYNNHRREIAEIYYGGAQHSAQKVPPLNVRGGMGELQLPNVIEGAIYLRFNILHPNAKEIIKEAKKQHILLGDWYKNVIDPIGTDFGAMKYTPGSCPNAERAARESINLPTHVNISKKDAMRIISFLKQYQK